MALFEPVPEKISYPEEEEKTLAEWKRIDAFKTSLERSKGKPEYSFYDGPPFATGLPHYGHLLAGSIKDVVTRYAHQTGHHVERRFGWDCHGLPVEYEIDKKLGIKSREDVLKMGIKEYNAECRSIVMRYSKEWETTVTRMGRWIDFENDYKTMDLDYMESVWWVFSELHKKGLVYQGFKVMPYSTACTTPLSNFEAGQNYKEVNDPAVVVSFPLVEDPGVSLVAWTTTPWTLPSNVALCVHPEFDYVRVKDNNNGAEYIILEARVVQLYPAPSKKSKDQAPKYKVLEKFKGATLLGKKYVPLFPYFAGHSDNVHTVVMDTYVTAEGGTGIVHNAPAFGEDDYRVCLAHNVIRKGAGLPCPVDMDGCFTSEVPEFEGRHVKEADADIMRFLKAQGRVVQQGTIVHSAPFCWRSETPLIYKAVPSWFVDVPSLKDKLLANNDQTYWVPAFVKEKRFANWLSDAREWAISRNRFWGTPLPIWVSDDGQELVVISSVGELERRTGTKITDIHRDSIDHLTIPSEQGRGELKRVDEVFDCWFESGSMPYAQQHFPFENKERFTASYFPADFIAEGLDQTRGWFYTLLVISTALFDKPAWKNLVVNGLVLAADGKKMSKSKKNYPDPTTEIIDVYGADALRLYLINSPVVRAEPLKFVDYGVFEVIKDVFNPWFNAYRFFVTYANRLSTEDGVRYGLPKGKPSNLMDRWILSSTQSLIRFVREEMAGYRLYTVVPKLVWFIDQLTNWWLRLNRGRLKGQAGQNDCKESLAVLFQILMTLCRAMGPFTPFLVEMMYRNLRNALPAKEREDSVHYLMLPEVDESVVDVAVEEAVTHMQSVIELARVVRDRVKRPSKYPLLRMVVVHRAPEYLDGLRRVESYVKEEANVEDLVLTTDALKFVTLKAEANKPSLGPKAGKAMGAVSDRIKAMTSQECQAFQRDGRFVVETKDITVECGPEDIKVSFEYRPVEGAEYQAASDGDAIVLLDVTFSQRLENTGIVRDVLTRVQRARKLAGLQMSDDVDIFIDTTDAAFDAMLHDPDARAAAAVKLKKPLGSGAAMRACHAVPIFTQKHQVGSTAFDIVIARPSLGFNDAALAKLGGADVVRDVKLFLATRNHDALCKQYAKGGTMEFTLNKKKVKVVFGKDVFLSFADVRS